MSFEVIPAIDVCEGRVVRLWRGSFERKEVYADDPVEVALRWEAAGALRLHVVDLDGAAAGRPVNRGVVARIVSAVRIPVQVGGGIRDLGAVGAWLEAGADRVVLGTGALTDTVFLLDALRAAGGRVVVALDARDREVRLRGWMEGTGLDVVETARRLAGEGVRRFIVTDISRDGTLGGPNGELAAEVAEAAGVPVLASGGVASVGDLRALAALRPRGVEGAVVGKALYTGAIDLREAVGALS